MRTVRSAERNPDLFLPGLGFQVRNLCYMITRREKLKLSYNKAQEQIFGLQVQLLNQEAAEGNV